MTLVELSPVATEAREGEAAPEGERLQVCPTFSLAFTFDGEAYVANEVEPYTQYWLSEPERVLLLLFSGPCGETEEGAIAAYLRLTDQAGDPPDTGHLRGLIQEMRATGVLLSSRDDTSRYDATMADDYLKHRPFPPELAKLIVRDGAIEPDSRVLDLAGGPGSLALSLAEISRNVSLMDLSRGFVAAAGREAARRGLHLTLLHDSCNRLPAHEQSYDVVTVTQALHWLDDVQVCRGVSRVLREDGSFFVMVGSMSLAEEHPLAFLLGDNSILGPKSPTPFDEEMLALMRRLTLLFEALDAPGPQARAPIVPAGLRLFRQTRPFGLGFARAFLSPRHIEPTGLEPAAFWSDVELRCAIATPGQLLGVQDWALLHFRRGGQRWEAPEAGGLAAADIGWTGPDAD